MDGIIKLYFRIFVSMCEWSYDDTKEDEILYGIADTFKEAWELVEEADKKYDGVRIELTNGEKVINKWLVGYLGDDKNDALVPVDDID